MHMLPRRPLLSEITCYELTMRIPLQFQTVLQSLDILIEKYDKKIAYFKNSRKTEYIFPDYYNF